MGPEAEGRVLTDRTTFLERIREAVAGGPPADLPADFPATPASGRQVDFETFRSALAGCNGIARLVTRDELSSAVAAVVREGSARRAVVTGDTDDYRGEIDRGLADAGAEAARPDPEDWRHEAALADVGITSAAVAVAATGSILVVPGPASPRVASLLPPAHLAIVPAERLVAGLEDVMPILAEAAAHSSAPVLVTGPSRTSDIEMTTVYGVHGPKTLRVLVVHEPA